MLIGITFLPKQRSIVKTIGMQRDLAYFNPMTRALLGHHNRGYFANEILTYYDKSIMLEERG